MEEKVVRNLRKERIGIVVSDKMDAVESVSMGAWFGIGTRNESASVNGVAHVLEHMVFKGSATLHASKNFSLLTISAAICGVPL